MKAKVVSRPAGFAPSLQPPPPSTTMEGVSHRTIATNGINMLIAEMGSGPAVLFLHGFPECWYSWRKQMCVFADAGFRAIAPDLRGYGDTDAPDGVEKYSFLHIVGDLIGLLDSLQVQKAFVVAHDWGAIIGWNLCLLRPDRVIALASLSVHFNPRHPAGSLVQLLRSTYGEHHYICRFQEPGKAEARIARMSPELYLKKMFCNAMSQGLESARGSEELTLPNWISEEDIAYYVNKFKKSGFTPPLNYYRAFDLSWELTAPWAGSKVMVPTLFIVGDKDIVYGFPGAKEYIHGGGMAADVPNLKDIIVLEGVDHFLHEEKPAVVNAHILGFFKSFGSEDGTTNSQPPAAA